MVDLMITGGPSSVATTQSEGNLISGVNDNVFYPPINATANNISLLGGLDANSAFNYLTKLRDYNNNWSAGQAQIQRDWQETQNAKAMQFNASEAAKNRDWQQMMSNTAHQREIADLKAAGLNPVLSAMNGNGASVTSGATASGVTSSGAAGSADTSLNSVLVNLLGSFLDAQTKLQTANINAINNLAVADKQGEINELLKRLDWNLKSDYTDKYPNNIWQFGSSIVSFLADLISPGSDGHPLERIFSSSSGLSKITTGVNSARDKSYRDSYKKYHGSELYGPPIDTYHPWDS